LPDSPVREARQADKLVDNLAQVVPVLVLAADPVAVVDPAAGLVVAGLVEAAADKEAVRVLAVDPVEVAVAVPALGVDPAEVAADPVAVAAAEAVFH
jgi:hypothetical protein